MIPRRLHNSSLLREAGVTANECIKTAHQFFTFSPNAVLMSARIIDVRLNSNASNGEVNTRDEIIKGLSRPAGQKILPQILLYDDEGLRIYDEITTCADYYLFPAEENLLKRYADDIVQVMQGKADQPMEGVVLELGAG
jgi:uncharacterized SAM-dependent methyltransferase